MRIQLGSVFSGIGAIEQALIRLNIPHDICFACDNGNINLEIEDVNNSLYKVKQMKNVFEKQQYVKSLYDKSSKTNFVKKSYLANYHILNNLFFDDIRLLDGEDFKDKVDLFVGGSPCQSFSIIGDKGGLEDTRGTLFYDYVRLVNEIKPKVFIYENVFGLLRHDKGKTWKIMENTFRELDYHYKVEVLDAKLFGIPQSRRRVFIVGFKEKQYFEKFHFPQEIPLKFTMQDFLEENTADGSLQAVDEELKIIDNRKGVPEERFYLSEKLKAYCLSPGTKNFMHKNAKIDLPVARALLSTMGNSHRSSINNYVTTNGRVRALTIREVHRLMGFPDSYKITVSKAQAYKQAGNSIVVDVLINLINSIRETGVF